MLFQLACSHYAFLPFSCAPWRCFVCLFVFHCFNFFERHSFSITKLLPLIPFQLRTVLSPHPGTSGPEGSIRVLPILYQILNSLSIFTLSFISLCASCKLFSSTYSIPSNLLLASLIGPWVSYPITLSGLAHG